MVLKIFVFVMFFVVILFEFLLVVFVGWLAVRILWGFCVSVIECACACARVRVWFSVCCNSVGESMRGI